MSTLKSSNTKVPEVLVSIPKTEYDELIQSSLKCSALEDAGVDNWDGYDYAMELLEERD